MNSTAGTTTQIYGTVNGTGTYTFTSTVNGSGDIVVTGTYIGSADTYTITIPHDVITGNAATSNYALSQDIYTANSTPQDAIFGNFTVTSTGGTTIDTAELKQVLHDVYAGYNFGFINSATIDPVTNIAFGLENSQTWFKDVTSTKQLYSFLQPGNVYYNEYAQLIANSSTSQLDPSLGGTVYGFAYADAIPGVTLNTTEISPTETIDGWNITVLSDVPEPTDAEYLMMGIGILFCITGRRKIGVLFKRMLSAF